jgi:UDP-GlcNAc3NAcA epimerase
MKLLSVVGARPQFIKIAPMCRVIAEYNEGAKDKIEDIIVHTGQHYDAGMSDIFFDELKIPNAHYHLGVGSCGHGAQTGRMLEKIEKLLIDVRPDMVIVYGDTNSTVAGAMAAVKLYIPVAHIEAGLRSFNKKMPEEINRIVADHVSDLLLAPTPTAMDNLQAENLIEKSKNVGDIMRDAVLFNSKLAEQQSDILTTLGLKPKKYGVVTIHRAENTDDFMRLKEILASLNEIAEGGLKLIFPVHPRTKNKINSDLQEWEANSNFSLIEPVGYLDMMQLVGNAALSLTDSGGLQKEAFFLNCPCITLRDETEWIETVESEGNIIAGADSTRIQEAYSYWNKRIESGIDFTDHVNKFFGRGNTAEQILEAIVEYVH